MSHSKIKSSYIFLAVEESPDSSRPLLPFTRRKICCPNMSKAALTAIENPHSVTQSDLPCSYGWADPLEALELYHLTQKMIK